MPPATWSLALLITSLVTAALVAIPSPAAAYPTDLAVSAAPTQLGLTVGDDPQQISFTIANQGTAAAANVRAVINVPLTREGVTITQAADGCRVGQSRLVCFLGTLNGQQSVDLSVQLSPPGSGGPSAGDVIQGQGQITVGATEQDLNRENNAAAYAVNLAGPAEPVGVTSVSGEVVDSESDKPVRGARVVVTDGADRKRTARTNNSGRFKVQGSTDSPIEPGSIKVVVTKKGYERKSYQTTSDDGEAVKANLYLLKKAKKSPSASATEKSAEPAAGPADDAGAGWGMWVLGILGTLLVLGGIGALLYPFINRRGEDDDEADAYGHAMRPGHAGHAGYGDQPTAVYGAARSGGINEPTSVYGAARSGGINEPTAMYGAARSGGVDQPTSMINQPTSMIRPPEQRTGSQSPPAAAGGRHGRNEDNPGYGGDPGYSNDLGYPSRGEPGSYSTPPGSYGQPGGSDVRGQSYGRHSHREVGDQGGGRHSGPSGVGQDPATDDQPRRPSPRRDRQLDWYDE